MCEDLPNDFIDSDHNLLIANIQQYENTEADKESIKKKTTKWQQHNYGSIGEIQRSNQII